jgi:hypothetical protein
VLEAILGRGPTDVPGWIARHLRDDVS